MELLCAAILVLVGRASVPAQALPAAPAPSGSGSAISTADTGGAPGTDAPASAAGAAPALDWPALWRRLRRSASVQRLLQTLLAEHEPTPQRLRECMAAADAVEATRLAHRLRGVAATVFAVPLREAAERLEQEFHTQRSLEPALVEALAQTLETLLATVRDGLAGLDANPFPPQETP
jgi:HPt (histidine-containing phosphotransfer) domain-containing protein